MFDLYFKLLTLRQVLLNWLFNPFYVLNNEKFKFQPG